MSWFPGTQRSGGPRPRRSSAAVSCCSGLPRCERSPLAITSSGSKRFTIGPSAHSAVVFPAPTCRSDTCRMRVNTGEPGYRLETVTDEATEIFDDLYLGIRAGGAVRKKRRGEPLTLEEQEALGRWQRLSTWRKAVAIGGFAVGTFGLGVALGGLVFGRWRKA